jgi:RNA ligase
MKYDLSLFEDEVEKGYIRRSEDTDLVLYNYTDKCVYDKAWNDITLMSRGIIFEKSTGNLVAKPFPKFFNLGEREETFLKNLPDEPYIVTEKYDGSLGIIFNYKGKWRVATRGSLNSEQAQKASILLHKYDLSVIPADITLIVEIIYPDNKIVVNYGSDETLILIGAYDIHTENEIPRNGNEDIINLNDLSSVTGLELAVRYYYSISEMIELQKTLPKDREGFVVRFDSGLRVKIKGDEYMCIAKMLSTMSPLSFWESMENGVVKKEYLQQLPEEFRVDFEPIVKQLEMQYILIKDEIELDYLKLLNLVPHGLPKKEVGLLVRNNPEKFKHPRAIFPFLKNDGSIEKYIMKVIRPSANVLVML